jgi:hypothetical protein
MMANVGGPPHNERNRGRHPVGVEVTITSGGFSNGFNPFPDPPVEPEPAPEREPEPREAGAQEPVSEAARIFGEWLDRHPPQ